jgi:hypothetical protein
MYTIDQLNALRTAVATGQKRVTWGDRTVEYRDLDEMQRLITTIETSIARGNATAIPPRQLRVTTNKGF